MNSQQAFSLLLFFFPVFLGAVVALAKPLRVVNWTDQVGVWVGKKRSQLSGRSGFGSRFLLRPFYWGLGKIDQWTGQIEDQFIRSGVRAGSYTYYIAAVAYVVLVATIVVIAIVLVLAAIWLGFWLLGVMLGDGEGSRSGYSVRRTRVFGGEYTQHYDESGKAVGTSEDKEGILGGKYTQHYDESGRKAGYSEKNEGLLGGKYSQHYDDQGDKAGHSDEREGLLGEKYTAYYDKDGTKIGRSDKKEGLFGEQYVEHRKQESPKGDEK